MESYKTFIFSSVKNAFEYSSDAVFNALEQGFGYYTSNEFIALLYQAKKENHDLSEIVKAQQNEIRQLRSEIEFMNTHVFEALNRDVMYMRHKLDTVIDIKPEDTTPMDTRYIKIQRFVEELDV